VIDEIAGYDIPWRQTFPHSDWDDPGDAVVWVDVASLDAAWRETDQWVSPNGKSGVQDNRYRRVAEWIKAGNIVDMCEIAIDEGCVSFTNGRHRFAWLRDRGARAMPVQVAPDSAAEFERRFGTPLRLSRLPAKGTGIE
jgi:hypothetical protein